MLSYLIVASFVTLHFIKTFAFCCIVTIVGSRYSYCCLPSGLVISSFHRRICTTSHGSKQRESPSHFTWLGLLTPTASPASLIFSFLSTSNIIYMLDDGEPQWYLSYRGFHPLQEIYTPNTYAFFKNLLLNN